MKKLLYYICSVVMLFAIILLSDTQTLAKESSTGIKKVKIEADVATKNHSELPNYVTGGTLVRFMAKVCLNDGSIAKGEQAKVKWELCRKDGEAPRAVYEEFMTGEGYAAIILYVPYGSEEDLQVVVYAADDENISASYDFKTVTHKQDGTAYFQFITGETSSKVKVAKAKESWNAADWSYTVILPEVKKNGKDEFVGWQDEQGNLYSPGETVRKIYKKGIGYYEFTAKWKTKKGTTFIDKYDKAKYKITGKNTVTLVKYVGKSKGRYHVRDFVSFHNNDYKITVIGKKAFSKALLKEIALSDDITKIGSKAFYHCKRLKRLSIVSSKVKTIGSKAIEGLPEKAIINCPNEKVKAYKKKLKKAGLKDTMTVK